MIKTRMGLWLRRSRVRAPSVTPRFAGKTWIPTTWPCPVYCNPRERNLLRTVLCPCRYQPRSRMCVDNVDLWHFFRIMGCRLRLHPSRPFRGTRLRAGLPVPRAETSFSSSRGGFGGRGGWGSRVRRAWTDDVGFERSGREDGGALSQFDPLPAACLRYDRVAF